MTNTKEEILILNLSTDSTVSLNQNWRDKRLSVTIFHPTDSALNILLICVHSIKLMCILFSFAFAVFVGKTGRYPDPQLPYVYKRPPYFVLMYVVVLTVSYVCVLVEVTVKFFTGYIDKGRIIMDETQIRRNYKRKKSLMGLDMFSLLPTAYLYLMEADGFRLIFHEHSSSVVILFVPQMVQIYRTIKYFSLPRQGEPFSASVLTAKTVMRIILVLSCFVVGTSIMLIFTSCSEIQPNCRFTWIEFAHKGYDVRTNSDILLMSIYFTITVLVTTGYGDFTGHRELERYALTMVMSICMILVAICQAKVTTSIFKIAARSKMYSDRIEKLRVAMEANKVKQPVIDHVTGYLRVAYGHHGGKQLQTLLRDLHPSLRKQVHYVICRSFIEQLPLELFFSFFKTIQTSFLTLIYSLVY